MNVPAGPCGAAGIFDRSWDVHEMADTRCLSVSLLPVQHAATQKQQSSIEPTFLADLPRSNDDPLGPS
jgi:hypothetical protein